MSLAQASPRQSRGTFTALASIVPADPCTEVPPAGFSASDLATFSSSAERLAPVSSRNQAGAASPIRPCTKAPELTNWAGRTEGALSRGAGTVAHDMTSAANVAAKAKLPFGHDGLVTDSSGCLNISPEQPIGTVRASGPSLFTSKGTA